MPDNAEQVAELKRIAARMKEALPPGSYWEYSDDRKSDIWVIAPLSGANEDAEVKAIRQAQLDFITDAVKLAPELRHYHVPIVQKGARPEKANTTDFCNHGHDQSKACYFGLRPETRQHTPALEEALQEAFGPPGPVPIPDAGHKVPHDRPTSQPPRDRHTRPHDKPSPLVDAARLNKLSSNYIAAVRTVQQVLRAETAQMSHARSVRRSPLEMEVVDMLDLQIDTQKAASRNILARLKEASNHKGTATLPPLDPLDNIRLQAPEPSDRLQGSLRDACTTAQKCSDEYVAALEEMAANVNTRCKLADGIAAARIVRQAVTRNVQAMSSGRRK